MCKHGTNSLAYCNKSVHYEQRLQTPTYITSQSLHNNIYPRKLIKSMYFNLQRRVMFLFFNLRILWRSRHAYLNFNLNLETPARRVKNPENIPWDFQTQWSCFTPGAWWTYCSVSCLVGYKAGQQIFAATTLTDFQFHRHFDTFIFLHFGFSSTQILSVMRVCKVVCVIIYSVGWVHEHTLWRT